MYTNLILQFQTELIINTLSNRSQFRVRSENNNLIITNSRNTEYIVDQNLFNSVLERYNSLENELKHRSGQYVDPIWENCPNRPAAIYIAAIIRHYLNQY